MRPNQRTLHAEDDPQSQELLAKAGITLMSTDDPQLEEMLAQMGGTISAHETLVTDAREHRIPEDETLRVPRPPARDTWCGATTRDSRKSFPRRTTVGSGISLDRGTLCKEYASSSIKIMMRIMADRGLITESSVDQSALQALDRDTLVHIQHQAQAQLSSLLPYGMLVISKPTLRFHELTQEELESIGLASTPIAIEGHFAAAVFDTTGQMGVYMSTGTEANTFHVSNARGTQLSDDTVGEAFLNAFLAAAQYNALAVLFTKIQSKAETYARKGGRLTEYAAALEAYIVLLQDLTHATVAHDVAFYSVYLGEAYEALVASGGPDARHFAREAARAYKRGIMFCEGRLASKPYLAHAWNCLGLALKRMQEFDMAERAYCWSLSLDRAGVVVRDNLEQLAFARRNEQSDDHDLVMIQEHIRKSQARKPVLEKLCEPLHGLSKSDKLKGKWLPGTILELHSLSRTDLNGQLAECGAWIPAKERYSVRLLGSSSIKWESNEPDDSKALKLANLRLPSAAEEEDTAQLAAFGRSKGHPRRQHRSAGMASQYEAKLGEYLARYPWSARAHSMLGDSSHGRGDYEAMHTHYQRATANGDIDSAPECARGLAFAQAELGQSEEAIRTYETVIDHAPTDVLALVSLSDLLMRRARCSTKGHDETRAISLLIKAIEHAGNSREVETVRAKALHGLIGFTAKHKAKIAEFDLGLDSSDYDLHLALAAAQAYTKHVSRGEQASLAFWTIGKCKERQADELGKGRDLKTTDPSMTGEDRELIRQMYELYVGNDWSVGPGSTSEFHPDSAAAYFERAKKAWPQDKVSNLACVQVQGKADSLTGNSLFFKLTDQFEEHLRQMGVDVRKSRATDVQQAIRKADVCRERGNAAIQSGENAEAVAAYNEAAALLGPFEWNSSAAWAFVLCLSNRAEARLRMEHYRAAADDCADASLLIERRAYAFDPHKVEAISTKLEQREAAASLREKQATAAAQKAARDRQKAERKSAECSVALRAAEVKERAKAVEKARKAEAKAQHDALARADAARRREEAEEEEAQAALRQARAREEAERMAAAHEAEARKEELRRQQEAARREACMARRRMNRDERLARRLQAEQDNLAREAAERQAILEAAAWADRENVEREARRAREAIEAEELELAKSVSLRVGSTPRRARRDIPSAGASADASEGSSSGSATQAVVAAGDDSEEQCAICYDNESYGELIEICEQGHLCHLSCASNWSAKQRSGSLNNGRPQQPTCPCCREPI